MTWVLSLFILPLDSQQLADDLASRAAERTDTLEDISSEKEDSSSSLPVQLKDQPFDLLGALVFAVGMGLLLVGVTKGNDWGWTSSVIAECIAGALLAFASASAHYGHC